MAVRDGQSAPGRHPWLDVFLESPAAALSDLLAGYAEIPPYERADAPDVVLRLFGALDDDDPARRALSSAVSTWLNERRMRPFTASRPRLQREIREVCEAFEIVGLLGLPEAAIALRRGFIRWNEWVGNLQLSTARDARGAYWRTLALTQPKVAAAAPGIDPIGLMPMWQEVCREAGGSLPQHYLSIGLLGLRRLPNSEKELQWLSGLAQWAMSREPTDAEFKIEWFGLKQLYPRAPEHWRKAVDKLLSARTFREVQRPGWWHVDRDLVPLAKRSFRQTATPLRSPMPEEAWAIADRLAAEPYGDVLPEMERVTARHRTFVESTGDPQYFVRFIHAVGTALIKRGVRTAETIQAAQALVREGLRWQPRDPYLLSLWQHALEAERAFHEAEFVGWESIRRNPDKSEARNQLATLLAELGRPDEAAALLQQTVERFPEDLVCRSQLATVLAERLGRPEDAEAVLRDAIRLFPEDSSICRNQLGKVLAERLGRPEEAEEVLREAIRHFPKENEVSRNELAGLLAERLGRPEDAEAVLREAIRLFPANSSFSRNQLGKLLAEPLGRPEEAEAVLREAIRLFPRDSSFSRSHLSKILADQLGRPEDAEAVLREAIRLFPHDTVIRRQLASMLTAIGRPSDAATVLQELRSFLSDAEGPAGGRSEAAVTPGPAESDSAAPPSDPATTSPDEPEIVADKPPRSPDDETPEVASEAPPPTLDFPASPDHGTTIDQRILAIDGLSDSAGRDYELEDVLRFGYLRRLRFRLETAPDDRRQDYLDELRQLQEEEAGSVYAETLATRYGIFEGDPNTLAVIPAAFEEALSDEDRTLLEQLAARRPRLRGLILVARALFGDEEAEKEIERLLSEPDSSRSRHIHESLITTLRPVRAAIKRGQPLSLALAERRQSVLLALYDTNESMLGGTLIAA